MASSESVSGPHPKVDPSREYTALPATRRTRETTQRVSGTSMRIGFFGLAAAWGFVVGVAGLLAALSFSGSAVQPDGSALMALLPVLGIALGGGWIIARAYEEAKQRRRR